MAIATMTPSSTPVRNNNGTNNGSSNSNNNNYAAPHTPIASAKRPRQASSRQIQAVTPNNNNSSENASSVGNVPRQGAADEHHNNNLKFSPPRTTAPNGNDNDIATPLKNQQLSSATNSRVQQMSPMHPPRRVPPKSHGDDKEDGIAVMPSVDEEKSSSSWVGRTTKTLFSPVLSFLNSAKNDGGTEVCYDDDGDVAMSSSLLQDATAPTMTTDEEGDEDQLNEEEEMPSNIEHHHDIYHDQILDTGDEDSMTPTETSTPPNKERAHHEEEEEEEEEEFNPYLFIKHLPPYDSIYIPAYHRSKICLPPRETFNVVDATPPIALVLDLDETLVHCTVEPTPNADMVFPVLFHGIEYKVHVRTRPYLKEFLESVYDKFEVVCFTASQKVYADELLDRIDPERKYIRHRMFRESCLPIEGNYLKDLNVLGRDLRKAVLVDNSPHAFGYQVDNGIPIESWFDDPNDTELLKLDQFLQTLHGVDDVRTVVRAKFQTYKLIRDA